MSHGLSREEIARRTRESREAQGLTPTITDPVALANIAALVRSAQPNESGEAA